MEQLLEAIADAAGAMENPKLDSVNPHFKSRFASLKACESVVRPKMAEHGLMFRQTCENDAIGHWLVTYAYGKGGEVEMSRVPLVVVNDPQKQGSALTYAKRYGLCAAFGLVGEEDDDGNAASERPQKPRKQPPRASTPPRQQKAVTDAEGVPMSNDAPIDADDLNELRASFVNYRNALGMDNESALAKLLEDTGIQEFGSAMTQRELQTAMLAMGKAIAASAGARVVGDDG